MSLWGDPAGSSIQAKLHGGFEKESDSNQIRLQSEHPKRLVDAGRQGFSRRSYKKNIILTNLQHAALMFNHLTRSL